MVNSNKLVSVLMSAYSEPIEMLKEAIDSILNQTYTNFEFLIYLDKPDNNVLWAFLQEFAAKDSRLIIHKNEKNRLLAGTLNDELKIAKGDYIIRMDGDDISVPTRIERLVGYMEAHSDIGVASSWMKEFGHKKWYNNRTVKYSVDFEQLKLNSLCNTPISHAACIIRRSVVECFGPSLYNERCCKTQDYELWSRLIHNGVKFGMVAEPLYLCRASHGDGPEPIKYKVIHNQVSRRNIEYVLAEAGIAPLPNDVPCDYLKKIRKSLRRQSGLLKRQLKMVICILYSNYYANPIKRIGAMICNGDILCLSVLETRMLIHFCLPGKLTEINNLVSTPLDLIYD